MQKVSRVLIAGCGDVGSALGELLVASGHQVFGLRRNVSALPSSLTAIEADLSQPDTMNALPEVDVLVYAAAADGRTESAYRAAYVDGLRNVWDALPSRPKRAFYTSSTAVFGQNDGSWVDETSPTEPASFTGAIVLEGETLLHSLPCETTVLRLAGIYGPGRTRLARMVRDGSATRSRKSRFTNRIHRDDCAGALAHLIAMTSCDPLYVGVDDAPTPLSEVFEFIAEQLGVPAPPIGDAPARAGNKRCRNAKLRATGYEFVHPTFRSGYPAIIDEVVSKE